MKGTFDELAKEAEETLGELGATVSFTIAGSGTVWTGIYNETMAHDELELGGRLLTLEASLAVRNAALKDMPRDGLVNKVIHLGKDGPANSWRQLRIVGVNEDQTWTTLLLASPNS
jgi:hypothetical protein